MRREESRYADDWFRIGDKEFTRAKNLFATGDMEGAGFNIQQAVEKYLKGFLLSRGWELRRIHEIEPLLNEAVIHEPTLEELRPALLKVTEYYVEERYPFLGHSELTEDEIRESLTATETLIARIRSLT